MAPRNVCAVAVTASTATMIKARSPNLIPSPPDQKVKFVHPSTVRLVQKSLLPHSVGASWIFVKRTGSLPTTPSTVVSKRPTAPCQPYKINTPDKHLL